MGYLDHAAGRGARPPIHGDAGRLDPDVIEQLRGGHAISIETAEGVERLPGATASDDVTWFTDRYRYFTGTIRQGPNLVGVALSLRPAARGSVAWLVIA